MKYYRCTCANPYKNAAAEAFLFSKREEALFLWINDPCVFIGRNQNPYAEVDLDYAQEQGIRIVRRLSGGGAVFQDHGNLNWSLIIKEDDFGKKQRSICRALRHMGFDVENSGRNDIMVAGKKLGGIAWAIEDDWLLLHGTILINTDLICMQRVLTPSKLKLHSHGIESVRSRVINLSEIKAGLTAEGMMTSFEQYYGRKFQDVGDMPGVFSAESLFRDEKRIFGESPQYDVTHEIKTPEGIFQLRVCVENGMIQDVQLFNDAMEQRWTYKAESLIGMRYEPSAVEKQLRSLLYV